MILLVSPSFIYAEGNSADMAYLSAVKDSKRYTVSAYDDARIAKIAVQFAYYLK